MTVGLRCSRPCVACPRQYVWPLLMDAYTASTSLEIRFVKLMHTIQDFISVMLVCNLYEDDIFESQSLIRNNLEE